MEKKRDPETGKFRKHKEEVTSTKERPAKTEAAEASVPTVEEATAKKPKRKAKEESSDKKKLVPGPPGSWHS